MDFDATENSTISLIVNNLRNSRAAARCQLRWLGGFAPPFYNIFAYNGYGRSYWLEYKINFGGGK